MCKKIEVRYGLSNVICDDCGEQMTEKETRIFLFDWMLTPQQDGGQLFGLCLECARIRQAEGDDPEDTLAQFCG